MGSTTYQHLPQGGERRYSLLLCARHPWGGCRRVASPERIALRLGGSTTPYLNSRFLPRSSPYKPSVMHGTVSAFRAASSGPGLDPRRGPSRPHRGGARALVAALSLPVHCQGPVHCMPVWFSPKPLADSVAVRGRGSGEWRLRVRGLLLGYSAPPRSGSQRTGGGVAFTWARAARAHALTSHRRCTRVARTLSGGQDASTFLFGITAVKRHGETRPPGAF